MKLIIQIPCFNEAQTLPETLADLPKEIEGVDAVEWLVIDDGSADGTADVAKANGVHHVVRLGRNRGLARAFAAGLDACLSLGADIIVNTDGDNQYRGQDIPALIAPILRSEQDIVIGDRRVETVSDFSATKIKLQKIGSWVVRNLSGTNVPDTTSGFRAFSREAALRLNVLSDFTYSLETIIQAGRRGMAVGHVPIHTNRKTRESRLFRSIPEYLRRSAQAMLRFYTMYAPLPVFAVLGGGSLAIGSALGLRFLYYYFTTAGPTGKIQSLIVAAIFLLVGVQVLVMGILADLISANRRLAEESLYRIRRLELGSGDTPGDDEAP